LQDWDAVLFLKDISSTEMSLMQSAKLYLCGEGLTNKKKRKEMQFAIR